MRRLLDVRRGTEVNEAFIWIATAVLFFLASSQIVAVQHVLAADGLRIVTDGNGRVTNIFMGSDPEQEISFCSGITGGFYIRENTLPVNEQIPDDCTNLIINPVNNPSTFYDGAIEGAIPYWHAFGSSDDNEITDHEIVGTTTSNWVARIHVDESENPDEAVLGHYAGIYHDLGPWPLPQELQLFYLTFEVKTQSGWRSKGHPEDDWNDEEKDMYGPHKISARVEWYGSDPSSIPPAGPEPSPDSYWVEFNAFETTDAMIEDYDHFTRFCGRTYRPPSARYARIVLQVEGYMSFDGPETGPGAVTNEVFFDNVYFFLAPPALQVRGADLFDNVAVPLYDDDSPTTPLNLSMQVEIQDYTDYLRIHGRLINPSQAERAIDLGFALPINDLPAQVLEWHSDMRNSLLIAEQTGPTRYFPLTLPGLVDVRPECNSRGIIPTSKFHQFHNLHVSAYPISALGIDLGGQPPIRFGLSYGDSLEEVPFTPSISHFGYRIDDASPYIGKYYVELNIGLLSSTSVNNSTEFSFIIFRSDNPDYFESSCFREGLEKYQREIYPSYFTRPEDTPDEDWLFAGGFYQADPSDQGPGGSAPDGYDDNPNDFGIRYTQQLLGFEEMLNFCVDRNVGVQIYDRPWEGTFPNSYTIEPLSKNTYDGLDWEHGPEGTYALSLNDPFLSIYLAKVDSAFKIPPGDKTIYTRHPYSFPLMLADSPVTESSLVSAEVTAYSDWYTTHAEHGECFSGIQLDNCLNAWGQSSHLDICGNDLEAFVEESGRLTYSFNHFRPAIPQLCTNVWFFPHARSKLAQIDAHGTGFGDNYGETGIMEQEVISVNANESAFGGSKYAIMNADVVGFESNPNTRSNNNDHAFNFRRSLARDKSVARLFGVVTCIEQAMDTIFTQGHGTHLWPLDTDFLTQIADEAAWMALAWGFHPSITNLFPDSVFGGDNRHDLFVDNFIRERFTPGSGADLGFTEVFRLLHKAEWKPIANVVNSATATSEAPGDPQLLFKERFGPYDATLPAYRPVFITIFNNDDLSLTCDNVPDAPPEVIPLSLSDLESQLEVEETDICERKYGAAASYSAKLKDNLDKTGDERNKNFLLDIYNPDKLTLHNGNLWGMQMIEHEANPAVVNSPDIRSATFNHYGWYSIQRYMLPQPHIRVGGKRFINDPPAQQMGLIEDKALMVFKIWTEMGADNGGGGGTEMASGENPYYDRYGNWQTVAAENAHWGSVDMVESTELGASALFKVDIGQSGRYDVRVHWPDSDDATSNALYEVYLIERDLDGSSETEEVVVGPVLTTLVDQSNRAFEVLDDEGYLSIGEIEVALGDWVDLVTVVVRLSSGGAEYSEGQATLLMADAVKLEEISF
jgi:hypothetical protein